MTKQEIRSVGLALEFSGHKNVSTLKNWVLVDMGLKYKGIYALIPIDIKGFKLKIIFFPEIFDKFQELRNNITKKVGGGDNYKVITIKEEPVIPFSPVIGQYLEDAKDYCKEINLV